MRGCDRRRQVSQKQRLTGFDQTSAANYLDSVSIAVPQAIDADGIRFLANDFFQSRLQCNQLRGIQQNLKHGILHPDPVALAKPCDLTQAL